MEIHTDEHHGLQPHYHKWEAILKVRNFDKV